MPEASRTIRSYLSLLAACTGQQDVCCVPLARKRGRNVDQSLSPTPMRLEFTTRSTGHTVKTDHRKVVSLRTLGSWGIPSTCRPKTSLPLRPVHRRASSRVRVAIKLCDPGGVGCHPRPEALGTVCVTQQRTPNPVQEESKRRQTHQRDHRSPELDHRRTPFNASPAVTAHRNATNAPTK